MSTKALPIGNPNLQVFQLTRAILQYNRDQISNLKMSKSKREEQDEEYEPYSDDFEEDQDDVGDCDDTRSGADEESYDDEIRVYKSLTGPILTIQPRPRKDKLRTPTKTESDGNLLAAKYSSKPFPQQRKAALNNQSSKSKPVGNNTNRKAREVEVQTSNISLHGDGMATSAEKDSGSMTNLKKCLQKHKSNIKIKSSLSKNRFGSALTSYSIRGGIGGGRKVPGSTNINNRNYTRGNKCFAVSPYMPLPPMKLGPAKPPGTVAQRVASARRMTMNDLKNRIASLLAEIDDLKKENRALNHIQTRQNQSLRKWEGRDAELPRLLQQHKEEARSAQDQLKKIRHQCREYEEKIRFKDKKILALESELQNLKSLVKEEHLRERRELQENLNITSANLSGAEKRIRQYMRHVEILEKNHIHQIAAEQQKLIKSNNHAMQLQSDINTLKTSLRDKDRMLNYIQMRSSGRNLIRAFQDNERSHNAKFNITLASSSGLNSHRSGITARSERMPGGGRRRLLRSRSLDDRPMHPEYIQLSPDHKYKLERIPLENSHNNPYDRHNHKSYANEGVKDQLIDDNDLYDRHKSYANVDGVKDQSMGESYLNIINSYDDHDNNNNHYDDEDHSTLHQDQELEYSIPTPCSCAHHCHHKNPHHEKKGHEESAHNSYYQMSQLLDSSSKPTKPLKSIAREPEKPVAETKRREIAKRHQSPPEESEPQPQPIVEKKHEKSHSLSKPKPKQQSVETLVRKKSEPLNVKDSKFKAANNNNVSTSQLKAKLQKVQTEVRALEAITKKSKVLKEDTTKDKTKVNSKPPIPEHTKKSIVTRKNAIPHPHHSTTSNVKNKRGNRDTELEVHVQIRTPSTPRSLIQQPEEVSSEEEEEEETETSHHSISSNENTSGREIEIVPSPPVHDENEKENEDHHRKSNMKRHKGSSEPGSSSRTVKPILNAETEAMLKYHEATIQNINKTCGLSPHQKPEGHNNSNATTFEGSPRPETYAINNGTSFIQQQSPFSGQCQIMPSACRPPVPNPTLDDFGFFSASPNYQAVNTGRGSEASNSDSAATYATSNQESQSQNLSPSQIHNVAMHQNLSPRGAFSYPQMTQQPNYTLQNQNMLTPRGAYSHPQVGQYQNQNNYCMQQDPRGVFSVSNNVSPRYNLEQQQPMNLPFFSTAGDQLQGQTQQVQHQQFAYPVYIQVPQQGFNQNQSGDQAQVQSQNVLQIPFFNHSQNQMLMSPQNSGSNKPHQQNKSDKQVAYDPSFYANLGSWK